MSKNSQNAIIVKIQSFVCGATENVLDEGDDLVQGKPDCLIIYSVTYNFTKGTNYLIKQRKLFKKLRICHQVSKLFSQASLYKKTWIKLIKKRDRYNWKTKNILRPR